MFPDGLQSSLLTSHLLQTLPQGCSYSQEATCAPTGHVRSCLSSPGPAAFSRDAKKQVYLAAPPALHAGNS